MPRLPIVLGRGAAALLALVCGGVALGCCVFSAPTYRGPPSDHFDGARFFDKKERVTDLVDAAKWGLTRTRPRWPEWIEAAPGPAPPARVDGGAMRVTFVNHATLLIQVDGVNVLTDPVWSERVSPVDFAGPRRVRPPGIRFEDLPPIDVVLVSHNHYDHMNDETLVRLRDAHHPTFLVGLGNELFLEQLGIAAQPLDWWQTTDVRGVRIHAVENQHFSRRGICDGDGTLWVAFVVDAPRGGRAYFAGDTGYGAHFAEVGRRFPDLRVALLPIGAYQPVWYMRGVHTSPGEAVAAARDLRARLSIPMHYGTFPLGDDAYDEPLRDLGIALDGAATAPAAFPRGRPAFTVLDFGQGLDVP